MKSKRPTTESKIRRLRQADGGKSIVAMRLHPKGSDFGGLPGPHRRAHSAISDSSRKRPKLGGIGVA